MKKVAVIGACGHVGLPFSLVVAQAGHKVYGVDIDIEKIFLLNSKSIPFYEKGAEALLRDCYDNGKIVFTNEPTIIRECDVIAIMIGTPVDSENNPRLDDIMTFIEMDLIDELHARKKVMKKDKKVLPPLIILRSTVAPGTTEVIDKFIEKHNLLSGADYFLVYSPERVAQGNGIEESKIFPQLIGCQTTTEFEVAKNFFKTFVQNDCIQLSRREAEMGKLMTNMYRYVNFALANEFYMIGSRHNVDIHKIIESCNKDYPRMNLALPGPNVGGPCLYKDGRFLLDGGGAGYNELITTAFNINEGMPDFIVNQIEKWNYRNISENRVLILGGAFKGNSDDTRNSLSFKLRKILKNRGCHVRIYDPYLRLPAATKYFTSDSHLFNEMEPEDVSDFDVIVLMTPHPQFKTFIQDHEEYFKKETLIIDIWKFFEESKRTKQGIIKYHNIGIATQNTNGSV